METQISPREHTPANEQELALTLLVELLAYQFASPVRWIETQNEFLRNQNSDQRYIEIGPANVLTSMGKKTAVRKYGSADAWWAKRDFISYANDRKQINFEYEPKEHLKTPNEREAKSSGDDTGLKKLAVQSPAVQTQAPAQPPQQPEAASVLVNDIPLTATVILVALVAQKLKRAFDNVPTQKSIRVLSGGKSTLQNELIGDLDAEFGDLPDGSEDLTLEALGSHLEGNFQGKHGKIMSAQLARLISSRMPAGFNQTAMSDHIQAHWRIGSQQQMTVLCYATTMEPATRIPDVESAKGFLDSVVQRYSAYAGLALLPLTGSSGSLSHQAGSTGVSAEAMSEHNKAQREYMMRQFDLLASSLQIDPHQGHAAMDKLKGLEQASRDRLDQWDAEFDETFFKGIQPIFDPAKGRIYDSAWNWLREDLIRLVNDVKCGLSQVDSPVTTKRLARILTNWDASYATLLQGLFDAHVQDFEFGPGQSPTFVHDAAPKAPSTTISPEGFVEYFEEPRSETTYTRFIEQVRSDDRPPPLNLRFREQDQWKYDPALTSKYLECLSLATSTGISFSGKRVLVTGCGQGSIGAEIVKGLLTGGAEVIATTSRTVSSTSAFFQQIYRDHGAKGSSLTVLPFNQASKNDCEALINKIYEPESKFGGDLDYIVPFAAIPDSGDVRSLDGKSELAHRAMLVNLLRMIGRVSEVKEAQGLDTRPTMVVLPLSPNHGIFGGDGLYSESKLGLETLFHRFRSENWSQYVTVCGAVIGWTRGTGLMSANNIVAAEVESRGALTFSQSEMALNILALMTPEISRICEDTPVYADLNGGLQYIDDLKQCIALARSRISEEASIRKAIADEREAQHQVLRGVKSVKQDPKPEKRARFGLDLPTLSDYETMTQNTQHLEGMVDLSRVVVVVGFSELGPWGNSRTRWEMECDGELSMQGYIEMAWIMSLIEYKNGDIKGKSYVGWVDSSTKEPICDDEIKQKYGSQIKLHAGIRFVEGESLGGYDPHKKEYMHEVAVEQDLPPFEASKETAQAFQLRHGNKVSIEAIEGSDQYKVRVKKGAHLLIPKSIPFDRFVAGQLPKGWDPARYGIPEDIISQVDPITLYALCCVAEAFHTAGIQDAYEVFEHMHVSEVANCLGTGAGALNAMRGVYQSRYLDRPVQSDILQESFLNTMGAWINMLLLGSTGPIKSPVGACATAVESLDSGCDAILTGKAKMAIVGGSDDFQEEMSYEFAKMKATCSTSAELEKGRLPSEMSRPCSTSRSGFVESAGCGVQIIMTAEKALEMGLPIHGIVAMTQLASDKIGRSVPAPGQGILTAAREDIAVVDSPLLAFEYRRHHFEREMRVLAGWSGSDGQQRSRTQMLQRIWANDLREQEPGMSPMRSALSTWGLTVDDIQVASLHGTSTKANDINETDVVNQQMEHLGRSPASPLLVVCQKSLTGHPKGAAGAWQLNGCMQMLRTGIVPGNKNADNIEEKLEQRKHLVFPSRSLKTPSISATMLTSFGFGQKGGIVIMVHPRYLFAAISKGAFESYRAYADKRRKGASQTYIRAMMENRIVRVKEKSSWAGKDEKQVFLDVSSCYRDKNPSRQSPCAVNIPAESSIKGFDKQDLTSINELETMIASMSADVVHGQNNATVGIDVEDLSSINIDNQVFLERNFTAAERAYCDSSPDRRASYAGKWAAKEAVFKSLQVPSRGAGASMIEIEIVNCDDGHPEVKAWGKAKEAMIARSVMRFEISIAHTVSTAIAIATATKV